MPPPSKALNEWDQEAWKRGWTAVKKQTGFHTFTKADVSKFLSAYFQKKIVALALAEGCNKNSGYPYWIIWYREK